MIKTSFVTASMISVIAEAVDIRQRIHQATEDLLTDRMLSQVATEIEMATSDRHSIYYRGPDEVKPAGMPATTPGGAGLDGTAQTTTDPTTGAAQVSSTTGAYTKKDDQQAYFKVDLTPGNFAEIKANLLQELRIFPNKLGQYS